MSTEFYWIAVAVITIMSAARITRLLTFDKFPPIKFFRDKYEDATDGSNWQLIAYCAYCMSPWVTLLIVGWGYLVDFDTAWFLVNGIFAASYSAAIIVALDKGEGDS